MTDNMMKNFATVTIAGAMLSFIVASTAVSVALVWNVAGVHNNNQSNVTSVQQR